MRFALFLRYSFVLTAVFVFLLVDAQGAKPKLPSAKPTAEQVNFFENKIRPILVDHCYACHSEEADTSEGGLFLDTKAGLLTGGDSGPAVIPGNAAKSIFIKAIKRQDKELKMPPDEEDKLSERQIADLEKWVKMGMPDPRSGAKALTSFEKLMQQGKQHWAFQPVTKPALPTIKSKDRVQSEVDHFILAKLEAKGLTFSQPAKSRELLRRVYYDLIGLPPTIEQVHSFEIAAKENSQVAFAAVVEELLKSPRYGERWGRHWLDIARYADNMGSYGGRYSGEYTHAHTYRDYVIRAFNEDKPYDQFLLEQLAADHLDLPKNNNRALAAMGFLTVGFKRSARRTDDSIADEIDTISRGLLGLSVGCARCHDHKLEPIPTRDYYSLYGILKSSEEPKILPELKPAKKTPELIEYRKKNKAMRTEFIRVHAFLAEKILTANFARIGDYLRAAHDGKFMKSSDDNGKVLKTILKRRNLRREFYDPLVSRWDEQIKGHPEIFRPWLELSALSSKEFSVKAPLLCKQYVLNKDKRLDSLVSTGFKDINPTNLQDIVWVYNSIFASLDVTKGTVFRGELKRNCIPKGNELDLPRKELLDLAIERAYEAYRSAPATRNVDPTIPLVTWLVAKDSPFVVNPAAFWKTGGFFSRHRSGGIRREAEAALDKIIIDPNGPSRPMVMVDAKKMYTSRVFIRGNAQKKGILAPRQFFEILAGSKQTPFPVKTSGRLEFAKAVIDPQNPLTARVIVNRVWQWHFGEGLVRTSSDFGFRGEKPTHPELLDYLAARFVSEGWSIKKLHRWILLSSTWQQSSVTQAALEKSDPDNRLWRRMNSRPLEFEPFRDSLLFVSGRLDLKPGGHADDIIANNKLTRRTVYARVDRKTFPNLFRIFDFPPPSFSTAKRKTTTLTPRALYLLNSPFITDNTRAIAKQASTQKDKSHAVTKLYQRILQRNPDKAELTSALKFLSAYPKTDRVIPEATDWLYGYGQFNVKTSKVDKFVSLSKFTDKVVKGSEQGDIDLREMEINAKGGKVAKDRATIRRWTAPYKGVVDVYAELLHSSIVADAKGKKQPKPEGDGVHCYIISSRSGKLGNWSAFNSAKMTLVSNIKVQSGDTIDFVTLCGNDPKGDTFTWAPTITMKDKDIPSMKGIAMRWDARTNFMDPSSLPQPLGPWEELAQVLLLSNEFAIVD